ncbi:MAG: ComEC/Rec2 family competence protein [Verrucomicrobiae bacterium]|nr:ComEC/Rec2 family competence protein [Verrucomicrobiae bacterium]
MKYPLGGITFLFALGIGLNAWLSVPFLSLAAAVLMCLVGFWILFTRHPRAAGWALWCAIGLAGAAALAFDRTVFPADDLRHRPDLLGENLVLVGTVDSLPRFKPGEDPSDEDSGNTRFLLRVRELSTPQGTTTASGRVMIFARGVERHQLAYGDRLRIEGRLTLPPRSRNIGLFDYRTYMERQNVFYCMRLRNASDLKPDSRGNGGWLTSAAGAVRDRVHSSLNQGLENEPEMTGLLSGMLLGSRADIPEEISTDFQKTGTFHILAVSGQNLTFLALVFVMLARAVGLSRWKCAWIVFPAILLYCAAVGWPPGCLRAFWMATALIGSWVLVRPSSLLNSVCFAALATLAMAPQQLFDVGFQLSFAVVIALVGGTPLLTARTAHWFERDPFLLPELESRARRWARVCGGRLTTLFCGSLMAWLGSLPLTLFYFHLFSPVTVLTNMWVVPLATVVLSLGLMSFLGGLVWPFLSTLYNNANFLFLKLLLAGVHFFAQIPGGSFYVPSWHQLREPHTYAVHILDVGEGQAAIVQTPQSVIVMDTGNRAACEFTLIPYLKTLGVNRIHTLVLSHADAQHMGGAVSLLQSCPVDRILLAPFPARPSAAGEELLDFLEPRLADVQPLTRGVSLPLDDTSALHVLLPQMAPAPGRGVADDSCLVARMRVGPLRILWAADAGRTAGLWLAESDGGETLRSEILVQGKHSKEPGPGREFLEKVDPALLVLCQKKAPDRLPPGLRIFRTGREGGMILSWKSGDTITVTPHLGPTVEIPITTTEK